MTAGEKPAEAARVRPVRPCPRCGKPSIADAYPFCSKRCADIDLNRWLSGAYAIPAVEGPDGDIEGDPGDGEGS